MRTTLTLALAESMRSAHSSGCTIEDPILAAGYALATPEMNAIRDSLLHLGRLAAWTRGDNMNDPNDVRRHLSVHINSPAVIDWVMGAFRPVADDWS